MTNEALLVLMKEAMVDDEKCLVLGDHLETCGVEIPECLATQGLAVLLAIESGDEELQRKFRRDQRVADIRVRTREVLRKMEEEPASDAKEPCDHKRALCGDVGCENRCSSTNPHDKKQRCFRTEGHVGMHEVWEGESDDAGVIASWSPLQALRAKG